MRKAQDEILGFKTSDDGHAKHQPENTLAFLTHIQLQRQRIDKAIGYKPRQGPQQRSQEQPAKIRLAVLVAPVPEVAKRGGQLNQKVQHGSNEAAIDGKGNINVLHGIILELQGYVLFEQNPQTDDRYQQNEGIKFNVQANTMLVFRASMIFHDILTESGMHIGICRKTGIGKGFLGEFFDSTSLIFTEIHPILRGWIFA
ncbi:MAG TPA: hypothetical protein VE954_02630 [Oligoflexus sp.]|uniref:hypothetical protein n=1 Tax=Oligoflexus sp. TaxID=1971216 RepID=UPI002D601F07|nr:hypothetical protein [Oligoflexus sp.]HYX31983.1 hypothetical protein [Oligoflexus sp.]